MGVGERRGSVGPPADEGHVHQKPAVHADPSGDRIDLPREQPQPVGGRAAQPPERLGVAEGPDLARVQDRGVAVRGGRLHAGVVLVGLRDHRQPQTRPRGDRHQVRHVGQVHASRTGRPRQSRGLDAPSPRADPGLRLQHEPEAPGAGLDETQAGARRGGGGRRGGAGGANRGEREPGSPSMDHGRRRARDRGCSRKRMREKSMPKWARPCAGTGGPDSGEVGGRVHQIHRPVCRVGRRAPRALGPRATWPGR